MTPRSARWGLFAAGAVASAAVGVSLVTSSPDGPGATQTGGSQATAPSALSSQRVVHVSPTGSDRNPGTAQRPLRTPQLAVDRVLRGGVVELADGTYRRQRVVITGGSQVTVRAAAGANPVLDAGGLVPVEGNSGVVEIHGGTGVSVSGLTVTGYRTRSTTAAPIGIYVTGAANGVTLTGNHVHHLGNDNRTRGSYDINAHGIAVYGDNATSPVTGLRITANEVDHLVLGASEAVAVNGNVDGWEVTDNDVHDNNNIAIVAIGYEPTLPGKARYTDANRARHGLIARNTVRDIVSKGNPSYAETDGWCNCAGGIYVDGGRSIRIENNTVTRADIGIEVASENPKGRANDVQVIGNTLTRSAFVGLSIGGYEPRLGEAYAITVQGNTLRGNNTLADGSPEVLLQYRVHDSTITDNRITATSRDNPALVHRVEATGTSAQNANLRLDRNDYEVAGPVSAASFTWSGRPVLGLAAWQRASRQDAHSTVVRR